MKLACLAVLTVLMTTVVVAQDAITSGAANTSRSAAVTHELQKANELEASAQKFAETSNHNAALPLRIRALAIYQELLGPEDPDAAESLHNLASTYWQLAQYDKALPLLIRVLAILEKALGPEHPATATILNNLAEVYWRLAQYDKALPLNIRALAVREKVVGPVHPATALSLNNLAVAYSALAQYDKALPLNIRALAIREKVLGPEHPDTAISLNNLALAYSAFAQHAKALPLNIRALAIREKVLGSQHPDTALSLNILASTYWHLAEFDKALPLLIRALAIYEKARGSEHPITANIMSGLAEIYSALAQYDKALPLKLQALAIREKVLGPEHPDTAESLNNLALTYWYLAQFDEALPLLIRALATFEKARGPEHPDTAISLENLAVEMFRRDQKGFAIALAKRAVNIKQTQRERSLRIDDLAMQSYTISVELVYQTLAQWLTDEGRLAEAQQVLDMLKESEYFEFIRRAAGADPRKTRAGYTAQEKTWMDRYNQIAGRLSALGAEEQALERKSKAGLTSEEQRRKQALLADLAVAQAAFKSFLEAMQSSFKAEGPARQADIIESGAENFKQLQATIRGLGVDVVLVRYYVTGSRVNMLVTTPGVHLARHSTIEIKELNRKIAEFGRLLRDPGVDPRATAQDLYRVLVAPIAADLEQAGAKTVMLSLDGVLRYIPFGALHDGERYLIERWRLPVYTEVAKDRLREAATLRLQVAGLGVTRKIGEFAALPAVRAELNSILRTGNSGVVSGELYFDEQFTEQRLRDVTQRPFQLLHIASHFRFSPGTEINSFLLLGDGKQLTLGDIRTGGWRFSNVDLFTLSACETGLGGGRDANGREIEGFGVIAQQQGAKGVLATLWPVVDQSTSIFMSQLYQRLQDKQFTKAESLRQAQLALLNGRHAKPESTPGKVRPRTPEALDYSPDPKRPYAHPYFWAPFILMGNWL